MFLLVTQVLMVQDEPNQPLMKSSILPKNISSIEPRFGGDSVESGGMQQVGKAQEARS
jgi:hypothetical protein